MLTCNLSSQQVVRSLEVPALAVSIALAILGRTHTNQGLSSLIL